MDTPLPHDLDDVLAPASPKQLAYLSYMSQPIKGSASMQEAEAEIAKIETAGNYEQWRLLVEKKSDWHTDRFILHPELFAEEFKVYYHQELPEILAAYVRSQAPKAAGSLTPIHIKETMDNLSAQNESWWRSPRRQHLFLVELLARPAFANGQLKSASSRPFGKTLQAAFANVMSTLRGWWSKIRKGTTS